MNQDWKENWIDQMGLIVALSGAERFRKLEVFMVEMRLLSAPELAELKEALRQRFTPSNGQDGCQGATEAVREAALFSHRDWKA